MPILVDPATITGNEVARTLKRRVCSECWGPLRYDPDLKPIPGFVCNTPGCTCQGTVAVRTVEIREERNLSELRAAKSAMADVLGLPARPAARDASKILAELGF